ncbi:MAG TPA: pyruvate, phosphate dikinase [Bacteroidetes bacterium]|nr:pyruvate, phosphate dikinase [Bacteroidota bacterium]
MAKKYVYKFGAGKADGRADMKDLLGGKGANLAEMSNLGIPVPPGFTITTEMCKVYYEQNKQYPPELKEQVEEGIAFIEKNVGAKFGDADNPLLVSVRSGAPVSMPGMMDTVLNLGLNDVTVQGLIKQSNNERFGWDSYRRFVQMYGDVVLGLKPESKEEEDPFEVIIDEIKKERGVSLDTELTAKDLKELVYRFKKLIRERKGVDFPEDPWDQLWGAIDAVFGSWMNPRAITYRKLNNIPDDWGTAVNVQAMVFGNMGDDSATGVAFTRDPATGEKEFYGEYLINAQGEDVVAGIRTPLQITKKRSIEWARQNNIPEEVRREKYPSLEEYMPEVYQELVRVYQTLERHYRDMQDIEFTIQRRKLWLLQTRTGKRTAQAAVRIAVDMVDEGLITKEEAIMRVAPEQLDQLLHPQFDPKAEKKVIARGLPASPGAATGKVVFHAEDAEEWAKRGEKVILVRIETSPEDIGGMSVAEGILTARGGMTSHAAVVARGMGKCCVAGCGALQIDYAKKEMRVGDVVIKEGDYISINGSTGEVMLGMVPTIEPELSGHFGRLMEWADEIRRLRVRTNADTPKDAQVARNFGAEGIGLCRTEHMFFEGDRILAVREMILADDEEGRRKALAKLLPMQRGDFYEIFKVMHDLPVTIRTLDPPLHEFLPHDEEQQREMAEEMGVPLEKIKAKVESLAEFNPMLGHRGCRLGITYPEITEMQARAIMEAACQLTKEGVKVYPEIMIPLVGIREELENQREVVVRTAEEVLKEYGVQVEYKVGTMIEVPRAALTADRIAEVAEFFSFGTNDLTQMTFGFSRDDAGKFLVEYKEKKILKEDPFQVLDQEGVGQLVEMGVKKGRKTRPDLKVGICGEHGGEPKSVEFCHRVGLDYVSCSPYRVPIARLAAAQAVVREKQPK